MALKRGKYRVVGECTEDDRDYHGGICCKFCVEKSKILRLKAYPFKDMKVKREGSTAF